MTKFLLKWNIKGRSIIKANNMDEAIEKLNNYTYENLRIRTDKTPKLIIEDIKRKDGK